MVISRIRSRETFLRF